MHKILIVLSKRQRSFWKCSWKSKNPTLFVSCRRSQSTTSSIIRIFSEKVMKYVFLDTVICLDDTQKKTYLTKSQNNTLVHFRINGYFCLCWRRHCTAPHQHTSSRNELRIVQYYCTTPSPRPVNSTDTLVQNE